MNKDSYHSMKRGLALSLAIHVILLSGVSVHFISLVPLPQQLEAIPITLAPLMQEFSSQQGAIDAPVRAIPAIKPTTKPQEKEEALHFGEGQQDSLAPFKPDEKPRLVETTSPPAGEASVPEKPSPELIEHEFSQTKTEVLPKTEPAQEDSSRVMPEAPVEMPQENEPKAMPEAPVEMPQEEEPRAMPEAPVEMPQENELRAMPEAPVETPQEDEPKAMPEAPVEMPQEDEPKAMPEAPVEMPQENEPKAMPEVPVEMPQENEQKAMPEAPVEVHKNEKITLPQEPAPAIPKDSIEQTVDRPKTPQITLPNTFPLPHFKPKSDEKSAPHNVKEEKKKSHQRREKSIEDILAMEENNLLNRVRTQGGGAKRSTTPEALGARKNINDITKMAQTLVSIVGGCIQQKLKLVALGGDLKNRPVVRLRFYLNREGMVVGDPIIDPLSGAQSQQAIMIRQVYAAVFSCQPYVDLPRDQYDLWGQGFDFNVDPLQEITQ